MSSYGTGRTQGIGKAYPVPSMSRPTGTSSGYGGGSSSGYSSSSGYGTSSSSGYGTSSSSGYKPSSSSGSSSQFPSSTQFTYSTGNPYTYTPTLSSAYPGSGPIGGKKFPPGVGSGGFRGRGGGRGRGRGGGGRGGQQQKKVKPPPPVPLSSDQKTKIENHNMKQLVAPKPPHMILNEMVGGAIKFEYTEVSRSFCHFCGHYLTVSFDCRILLCLLG